MLWIYDIETYQNFFSVTFKDYNTKEVKQYVINEDRNDTEAIIEFLPSEIVPDKELELQRIDDENIGIIEV